MTLLLRQGDDKAPVLGSNCVGVIPVQVPSLPAKQLQPKVDLTSACSDLPVIQVLGLPVGIVSWVERTVLNVELVGEHKLELCAVLV